MKRISLIGCILLSSVSLIAQTGAKNGEWRSYGADVGNTHYSALDQINASNFSKLEMAWRFKTDNLGPRPEFQYEGTPLMANGVLYATGGTRRAVFALDPGNRRALLDSQRAGRTTRRQCSTAIIRAWPRLLDRRTRGANSLRHAGLSSHRIGCEDRNPGARIRTKRRCRFETG